MERLKPSLFSGNCTGSALANDVQMFDGRDSAVRGNLHLTTVREQNQQFSPGHALCAAFAMMPNQHQCDKKADD
jgi:hypothetical protein